MFSVKKLIFVYLTAMLALASLNASAQLADKKVLNLNGAKTIAAAAELHAIANKWNVIIAVVDDGGHLIYLQRLDGAPTGSVAVAIGKARTSAAFKGPTKVFDDMLQGRPSLASIPNAVFLEGGVPVMVDGQVVGAVGVSGASSQQDAEIAAAGITALKL